MLKVIKNRIASSSRYFLYTSLIAAAFSLVTLPVSWRGIESETWVEPEFGSTQGLGAFPSGLRSSVQDAWFSSSPSDDELSAEEIAIPQQRKADYELLGTVIQGDYKSAYIKTGESVSQMSTGSKLALGGVLESIENGFVTYKDEDKGEHILRLFSQSQYEDDVDEN